MSLSGAQVTSWADKNNPAVSFKQSILGQQPTYLSNAINGKSVVFFNGNDIMTASVSSDMSADITKYSAYNYS